MGVKDQGGRADRSHVCWDRGSKQLHDGSTTLCSTQRNSICEDPDAAALVEQEWYLTIISHWTPGRLPTWLLPVISEQMSTDVFTDNKCTSLRAYCWEAKIFPHTILVILLWVASLGSWKWIRKATAWRSRTQQIHAITWPHRALPFPTWILIPPSIVLAVDPNQLCDFHPTVMFNSYLGWQIRVWALWNGSHCYN